MVNLDKEFIEHIKEVASTVKKDKAFVDRVINELSQDNMYKQKTYRLVNEVKQWLTKYKEELDVLESQKDS